MATKHIIPCKLVLSCRSRFPIDMLRHDNAWPASEADSGYIHELLDGVGRRPLTITVQKDVYFEGSRRAAVSYAHLHAFTLKRWESFGVTPLRLQIDHNSEAYHLQG